MVQFFIFCRNVFDSFFIVSVNLNLLLRLVSLRTNKTDKIRIYLNIVSLLVFNCYFFIKIS